VRPWLNRAVYVVLAAEIAGVVWYAVAHTAVDFSVYLWGGHAIIHDGRLYLDRAHGHWFTYPPFAAVVFVPVSLLPVVAARLLWELVSVAAFVAACVTTLKLAGWRPTRTAVAAVVAAGLLLEPVYHTLFAGQINTILLALVLADVWRVARGRRAGIGVGIAAAIKLTPAIFVLVFLLARRTRAAVTAVITFAACGLVGYLVAPAASRLYWTRFFYDTSRIDAPYIGNQSPYGAAIRLFGGIGHVGHWYLLVSVMAGVTGLAAAAVFARREDWLSAVAVTGATSLLVSPISWTHHWVWIVPALAVLARGGTASRIAAACGFALFALAPLWWTPHSLGRPDYGFHWLLTVVANCYLVAGLAFLAYMAVRAYLTVRPRPGRDPGAVAARQAAIGLPAPR
jgi:Glycosyltransferase family 87